MTEAITIRRSTTEDRDRVRRLAQLDSGHAPAGPALLAEVGGELRVALGLRDGHAVADPFAPTADVVEMLRALVAAEREGERARQRGSRLARLVPLLRQEARHA